MLVHLFLLQIVFLGKVNSVEMTLPTDTTTGSDYGRFQELNYVVKHANQKISGVQMLVTCFFNRLLPHTANRHKPLNYSCIQLELRSQLQLIGAN